MTGRKGMDPIVRKLWALAVGCLFTGSVLIALGNVQGSLLPSVAGLTVLGSLAYDSWREKRRNNPRRK